MSNLHTIRIPFINRKYDLRNCYDKCDCRTLCWCVHFCSSRAFPYCEYQLTSSFLPTVASIENQGRVKDEHLTLCTMHKSFVTQFQTAWASWTRVCFKRRWQLLQQQKFLLFICYLNFGLLFFSAVNVLIRLQHCRLFLKTTRRLGYGSEMTIFGGLLCWNRFDRENGVAIPCDYHHP